jgi:hypothetical protein
MDGEKRIKMKSNLNKWQGIEQEFRIGIRSIQPFRKSLSCKSQVQSQELHEYAIRIFNALKGYKFFDERPAIIYSSKNFNGFMRNGSRIYLCDSLPEIATPECRNAFELLKYDKASEFYMQLANDELNEELEEKKEKFKMQCWKANTELKPEFTRGTHENYSIDVRKFKKEGEFKKDCLIPFLILKPIFFGAGGYVSEGASDFSGLEELIEKAKYVVSPKAMATRRVYGGGGSRKHSLFSIRGISNLRIHVDAGEGLRSEVARLLNNAITSYVLQAIESGKIDKVEGIEDPIGTFRDLSRNIEGDWKIRLENGERVNALDYLNSTYIDALDKLFEERESSYWDIYALKTFKELHTKLEQGLHEDSFIFKRIEWLMKLHAVEKEILEGFEYEGEGKEGEKEKKIGACFDFSNIGEHDLYEVIADKIGVERILREEDIGEALLYPPEKSRALVRNSLIEEIVKFQPENLLVRWNRIINPPTRDEEVNFDELEGWTEDKIKRKMKEAKRFCRNKHLG